MNVGCLFPVVVPAGPVMLALESTGCLRVGTIPLIRICSTDAFKHRCIPHWHMISIWFGLQVGYELWPSGLIGLCVVGGRCRKVMGPADKRVCRAVF